MDLAAADPGTPVPGWAGVRAWVESLPVGAGGDGRLTDAERVDRLRAAEELKAILEGAQAVLAADLAASREAEREQAGAKASKRSAGVAHEVALARRVSPHRGSILLGLARVLRAEMPHTLTQLRAGRLTEYDATVLARETACLSREDRAEIDEQLCADPSTFEGWGPRRFADEARARAQRLDPRAAVDRARRARAERCVTLRPAPDTMTYLTALLPVEQGVAVYAGLKRAADSARAAGDERSGGQVMADTLVERATGQAQAADVAVAVQLTMPDQTLLEAGPVPAQISAAGVAPVPLPAPLARELTLAAVAAARASLRRLFTAPTGALTAMESRARVFPAALAHLIDIRDQRCRTPWCDAPVRHHDHVRGWADGGPTTAANSRGLCEACNYAAQAAGWSSRRVEDDTGVHTVETVTPTGHRHRSRAPDQPVRVDLAYPFTVAA